MPEKEKEIRSRTTANGEGGCKYIESKKLWCARITVGWKMVGDKKRQIRPSFYGKTKKEALQKATAAQARVMQGQAAISSNMKFADLIDKWVSAYKSGLQPNTLVTYKSLIENWIKPVIGEYTLKNLKPIHIQKMIADAVISGASSSVVKKMKVFTNAALEMAIDNDLLIKNPCRKIKLPPMPKNKHERGAFTQEEENRIIEYAPQYAKFQTNNKPYNVGWAIIVLLKTGLRMEELLGLRWSDIDFVNHKLSVCQTVSMKSKAPYLKSSAKTEKSLRTIPLHPKAEEAINSTPKIQNHFDLIFCNADGGIWAPRNFQRSYSNFFESLNESENKVVYRSPHCCRHTFATDLNKAGVDIKTISMLLGHSKVEMSLNVYTHTDAETMAAAVSKL